MRLRKLSGLAFISIFLSLPLYADPSSAVSLESAVASAASPKAVAQLLHKEFKFQEDQSLFKNTDYWQSPEEFWNRKAGDCEDFALFARYALEQHGIEAYVINVYGPLGYAHTVTVFREEGRYNVINQDKLHYYRAKTLETALSKVYPDWIWAARAEMKYAQGFLIQKIKNPSPSAPARFKDSFQKTL